MLEDLSILILRTLLSVCLTVLYSVQMLKGFAKSFFLKQFEALSVSYKKAFLTKLRRQRLGTIMNLMAAAKCLTLNHSARILIRLIKAVYVL